MLDGTTDPQMQIIEAITDDILDMFQEMKLTDGEAISITTSLIVNTLLSIKKEMAPHRFKELKEEVLLAMGTVDTAVVVERVLN